MSPESKIVPGLEDRLAAGDQSAFREFVEAYKRKFYGLAFEYTRNHADAEDVSQVAFIKIFRSIGTFQKGANLNSWVYRIVVNTAIDHIRKRPFFPEDFAVSDGGETAPSRLDPARTAESVLIRRQIDEALDAVSERERTAFLLRHDHGLSLQEIAEVLEVSVGSVKSYLFRSSRKLQKILSKAGFRLSEEITHA
jgi:RNA polymerase sigma-70 factor (ECF subfamily)